MPKSETEQINIRFFSLLEKNRNARREVARISGTIGDTND